MSAPIFDYAAATEALLKKLNDVDKSVFNWLVATARDDGAREIRERIVQWRCGRHEGSPAPCCAEDMREELKEPRR